MRHLSRLKPMKRKVALFMLALVAFTVIDWLVSLIYSILSFKPTISVISQHLRITAVFRRGIPWI